MTKSQFHIDFSGFHAGDKIDDELNDLGVTVSATDRHGNHKDAMIFDSANPTGGDHDLETDTLGNVLIISEDGDSHDPDDNAGGGIFTFDFANEAKVQSLTFLDIEETAKVRFLDEHGNVFKTVNIPAGGNNEIFTKHFNVEGVASMEVELKGSGAIDNLKFEADKMNGGEPDGIVTNDNDGDLIDAAYDGDPQGDVIDGNDAILPGEVGDDDIVDANGGNDTIFSGDGDDEVYAGSGDDSVEGGDGNDVIFGDSNLPGGSNGGCVRESFEWDLTGAKNDQDLDGFTQNTGNVDVTFSVVKETGHATTKFETDNQNVSEIIDDGNGVDDNSSLSSTTNGHGNKAEYCFDFSEEVEHVSFRINDIDGDGVVTVKAFDAHGDPIIVNLTGGSKLTLLDTDGVAGVDTADSKGGYLPDTSTQYSLLVNIPGPVSKIEILHTQDGGANSGINITDIYFDAPLTIVDDGSDGNDIISGGDGNDTIFGEGGNDTLAGDDGNDSIEGGKGDDAIHGGDGDDTLKGGDGNDEIGGNKGNDLIEGGDGDDTIFGQDGEDTIKGGDGNDSLIGGQDGDEMHGGKGKDTILGFSGDDLIKGGKGDDNIVGGGGDDTIFGEEGNDSISGGNNVDVIDGGDGNDTITAGSRGDTVIGGDGQDSILGESGDDFIDAGVKGLKDRPDLGYPPVPDDADPNNDKDFVDGGTGNDTIFTGDDDDTIIGGEGDDVIDGGFDKDDIDGGEGNDRIVGGEGSDSITGGDGNDTIFAGIDPDLGLPDNLDIADVDGDLVTNNGKDFVDGGDGDDVIFGADDDDTLLGGADNDFIDGGVDDDEIDGGSGDDTIVGGQGEDTLKGGDDRDLFKAADINPDGSPFDPADNAGTFIGDSVDGGTGGDDFDVLDLRGTVVEGGRLQVIKDGRDADDDSDFGRVLYFDENDSLIGQLDFKEIEDIIVCFTPGTAIATPHGERAVESLRPGDKVITRDNGIQEIAWAGARSLSVDEMELAEELRPVHIAAGALGPNMPERDIIVSPQHRVLMASDKTQLFFEEREVLVAAKHLVGMKGVTRMGAVETTYIHFMCQKHEVVLSDGAWTETFQPGDYTLGSMGKAARDEIFALFPELATQEGLKDYASARKALKRHEAALLAAG